ISSPRLRSCTSLAMAFRSRQPGLTWWRSSGPRGESRRFATRRTRSRRPSDSRSHPVPSMLYDLIRPLLFRLDAERAHEIALGAARLVGQNPWLAELIRDYVSRPVRLEKTVAGIRFPNPIGLAAGMDKNAVAPLAWWAF